MGLRGARRGPRQVPGRVRPGEGRRSGLGRPSHAAGHRREAGTSGIWCTGPCCDPKASSRALVTPGHWPIAGRSRMRWPALSASRCRRRRKGEPALITGWRIGECQGYGSSARLRAPPTRPGPRQRCPACPSVPFPRLRRPVPFTGRRRQRRSTGRSRPVFASVAVMVNAPPASTWKVTSICGSPGPPGGICVKSNSPSPVLRAAT
jgi:hypothetical protein